MQQRLPALRSQPVAFAHRGARAHAPENTIAAFELALRLGANGLESDVWTTSDSVPVLDHDGVVRRGVRRLPIERVERTALPRHIPDVDSLFGTCGTDFHLSLDIKDPAAITALAGTVARAGFPAGQLWLCSPVLTVLGECRERIPGAHLVHSTRTQELRNGLEVHCARLVDAGIDTLNLHHTEWTGGHVVMAHRFGLHAFAWDIQHEEPMTAVLRMGMDGVYSDRVDMMCAVMSRETGAVLRPAGEA